MRPEVPIPNLDHLIERYQSGVPVKKLAEEIGIRPPTLSRRMRKAGVKLRGRAEARRLKTDIPTELRQSLFQRYKDGESVPSISASTGLSYDQIYNLFQRVGFARRPVGMARTLMFKRMPPERRVAHAEMLRASIRKTMLGRKHTEDWRVHVAQGRFRRQTHHGVAEDDLAQHLRDAGLEVTQQLPVGRYNLDLAIRSHRIAVEIERPKSTSQLVIISFRKRTEYLINAGWTVLIAFLSNAGRGAVLDTATVAKDVIAMADILSWNESAGGQYGVVGGNRNAPSSYRAQLDGLPFVECPRCGDDSTGHYLSR